MDCIYGALFKQKINCGSSSLFAVMGTHISLIHQLQFYVLNCTTKLKQTILDFNFWDWFSWKSLGTICTNLLENMSKCYKIYLLCMPGSFGEWDLKALLCKCGQSEKYVWGRKCIVIVLGHDSFLNFWLPNWNELENITEFCYTFRLWELTTVVS